MATLSALVDRVYEEFPSVPEDAALRALSDAAKEFCSRTQAWQEALPPVSLAPGTTVYTLTPAAGTKIVAPKEVRLDGVRLTLITAETRRLRAVTAGSSMEYTQIRPDVIELTAAPTTEGQLSVTAALTLVSGATDVDMPDFIIDEHAEALAMGAKMRLARQANQPWSATDLVTGFAAQFYSAINTAKSRAVFAMGEAGARVEMRPWA